MSNSANSDAVSKTSTTAPINVDGFQRNHCFTMKMACRFGNLMFQYAALVGICKKCGFREDTCAAIFPDENYKSPIDLPFLEFTQTFNITTALCPSTGGVENIYREKSHIFDPMMINQPP